MRDMLLNELFGENARIKILEELLAYVDSFLTADEISRMADVSPKTVYIHMNQLEEIGILEVEKKGAKRFIIMLRRNQMGQIIDFKTGESIGTVAEEGDFIFSRKERKGRIGIV